MNETIVVQTYCIKCCSCGIYFWVDDQFDEKLRRTKKSFYCPNGHSQAYTTNEADRLRKQLEEEKRKSSQVQFELIATERKVKRLEKRIKNGVCPCCHRQFIQMARHMKSQHPDYTNEIGEKQ